MSCLIFLLAFTLFPYFEAEGILGDEDAQSFREYGKNGIKLLYLNDKNKYHQVTEITVKTRLVNDNEEEYEGLSNEGNVPTDTQKNLVYVLAKKYGVAEPEIFGQILANFFLEEYPHISRAKIEIVQTPWARSLDQSGFVHTHGFVNQGQERTAKVILHRGKAAKVWGGLSGFRILKTKRSSHVGFHKDQYTTLEDEPDRMLSTVVDASWKYTTASLYDGPLYTNVFNSAIRAILDEFLGPAEQGKQSTIIQETQRRAQKALICRNPGVQFVEMAWPNKHYFPWDWGKFPSLGLANATEFKQRRVYIAGVVPYGVVHTGVHRDEVSCLNIKQIAG